MMERAGTGAEETPTESNLREVLDLLRMSREPNPDVQRRVYLKFQALRGHLRFNQCLAYIFSNPKLRAGNDTRRQAGIVLRANLQESKAYLQMGASARLQMKDKIVRNIGDECRPIRLTVGSLLAKIAQLENCEGWGGFLKFLVQNLDNRNEFVQDGTVIAIDSLMEDCGLKMDTLFPKEIEALVTRLMKMMRSPQKIQRVMAISACGQLICPRVAKTMEKLGSVFVASLIEIAKRDDSTDVLIKVCWAFIALQEAGASSLRGRFMEAASSLVKFGSHSDERVVYGALEFWNLFLEPANRKRSSWFVFEGLSNHPPLSNALREHVPSLVPFFLKNMAFSPEEVADLGEEKTSHIPDEARDIAPRHARHRQVGIKRRLEAMSSGAGDIEWSIRKSAAKGLDNLARYLRGDLLPVLMPLVSKLLNHEDWTRRESAILALGAIVEGCNKEIQRHAPKIFQLLIERSDDRKAPIRQIACWTLSQYAGFVLRSSNQKNPHLRLLVKVLLDRMGDGNKNVQKAAVSAVVKLCEISQGSEVMLPFIRPIIERILVCISRYQEANLQTLFDCITTVAYSGAEIVASPKCLEAIIPKLLKKWAAMNSSCYGLFPLLECLSALANVAEKNFQPYAKVILPQCLKLISAKLKEIRSDGKTSSSTSPGEFQHFEGVESVICCAELAGSICRSSKAAYDPSVIIEAIFQCATDKNPQIRQPGVAWLGDFTCMNPKFISSCFPTLAAKVLLPNIDSKYPGLCSNSAWALGEAAVRIGPHLLEPSVEDFMKKLIQIIRNPHLDSGLLHVTAITISRLGLMCPKKVSAHLQHFGKCWCQNLIGIEHEEAETAYRGLSRTVSENPQAMLEPDVFATMCDAIASNNDPSEELHLMLRNLLHNFRKMVGGRWSTLFGACNPELGRYLAHMYDL